MWTTVEKHIIHRPSRRHKYARKSTDIFVRLCWCRKGKKSTRSQNKTSSIYHIDNLILPQHKTVWKSMTGNPAKSLGMKSEHHVGKEIFLAANTPHESGNSFYVDEGEKENSNARCEREILILVLRTIFTGICFAVVYVLTCRVCRSQRAREKFCADFHSVVWNGVEQENNNKAAQAKEDGEYLATFTPRESVQKYLHLPAACTLYCDSFLIANNFSIKCSPPQSEDLFNWIKQNLPIKHFNPISTKALRKEFQVSAEFSLGKFSPNFIEHDPQN